MAVSAPAPRVLWVTEHHPPSRGGMAQSSDRIVGGLRRAGVAVDVCHLTRADRPWAVEGGTSGRLLACPLGDDPEHALRRAALVVRRQHEVDPYTHVVAFGGTLPLLGAPVMAAWLDAPLVTLLRGNDLDTGLFSLRRQPVVLTALERSATVVVVARSMVPMVRALMPTTDPVWVPNGIELADWEALPSELDRARSWRAGEVPDGRRTIGLVGQLKAKKGVLALLDALDASGLGGSVHLVLVGEAEPAVDARLATEPADDRSPTVSRLPFLDRYELLSLLPACDVVALPSFYDGLPNVALEAGALGIPLLASDAGGLADLVDDGVHGFRFPAGDAGGLGDSLRRLAAASSDELRAMGTALAARVASEFTAARETEGYLAVLDRTAGGT